MVLFGLLYRQVTAVVLTYRITYGRLGSMKGLPGRTTTDGFEQHSATDCVIAGRDCCARRTAGQTKPVIT